MTAYMMVHANVTDPARLRDYAQAAEHLFVSHGAKLLARGPATRLEGEHAWQGGVIFEWPDEEAARAVWQSGEYAAIHRLREGAAIFQVTLIDGLAPAPAAAP